MKVKKKKKKEKVVKMIRGLPNKVQQTPPAT